MRHDRVTKTYTFWLRWPRWRSRTTYAEPVNWTLFRWGDFAPLAVGMIIAGFIGRPGWLSAGLAAFYFGVFPIIFSARLRGRRRYCASRGHHYPSEVVPGEWRCAYCHAELESPDAPTVATSVAYEASRAELNRRRQSFYSDRR